MNVLSESERDGLDEVFLSINTGDNNFKFLKKIHHFCVNILKSLYTYNKRRVEEALRSLCKINRIVGTN